MTNGSFMQVESIAECLGAFCNTFDLHLAIIGLEKQFSFFLRAAVLDRFYCNMIVCYHMTPSLGVMLHDASSHFNT